MNEQHKRYSEIIKKVLDPTGQRTAKVCLTPYMYDNALWERMKGITEAYANLLEFVFREYPTNLKIQEVLEYPDDLERYLSALNIVVKNIKCIYNVNPYIYNGKLGGFLNRASTDKLTSFKSGEIATIMPCFERTQ